MRLGVSLFVDGATLYSAGSVPGFDICYRKLLKVFAVHVQQLARQYNAAVPSF